MVGLKQKRSGELFEGSYEGRSLLLGKSWGSARRAYCKKKNGTAVDLKGGRRREQETNKDLSGLGFILLVQNNGGKSLKCSEIAQNGFVVCIKSKKKPGVDHKLW